MCGAQSHDEDRETRVLSHRKRGLTLAGKGRTSPRQHLCNNAEAYNNRGNAYRDKGEFDHAIQNYSKAIELKPDLAEAYFNRGIAYSDKDEFDQAIQDYTKAIGLNPNYATAYYNRGVAYSKKTTLNRRYKTSMRL